MAVTEPITGPAVRIVFRALLFPFAVLAGYFVAWGVVFCMDALTRWIFGTITSPVGWIPYAGRLLTRPINAIEQKLTSYLGGLEAHFEHQMGVRWHTLAQVVRGYASDTVAAAVYNWHVAQKIAYLYGLFATGRGWPVLKKYIDAQLAKLHGVTRIVVHTEKVIEHTTVGPIAAGATARVKPVSRALEHVIEWDLPHLRARDRALADQIGRLWHWTRTHGRTVATGIGLGALVYALGRLGLGWVRCRNVGRVGKNVCGMNSQLLESLLADSLLIAGSLSLVELGKELQPIVGDSARVIQNFWRIG